MSTDGSTDEVRRDDVLEAFRAGVIDNADLKFMEELEHKTQEALAAELGVTKQAVSKRRKQILAKVRAWRRGELGRGEQGEGGGERRVATTIPAHIAQRQAVEEAQRQFQDVAASLAERGQPPAISQEDVERAFKDDAEFIRRLLERVEDLRRPVVYQWILAHKYWNQLLVGLGASAFRLYMLTRAGADADEALRLAREAEDPWRVVRDFEHFFTSLLNARDQAARIMELERELETLKVDYDFTSNAYNKLEKAYLTAVGSMCKSCKEKFLLALALREVVGVG